MGRGGRRVDLERLHPALDHQLVLHADHRRRLAGAAHELVEHRHRALVHDQGRVGRHEGRESAVGVAVEVRHDDPLHRLSGHGPLHLGEKVPAVGFRGARVDQEDGVAEVEPGGVRDAEPADPGVRIGLDRLERGDLRGLRRRRRLGRRGSGDEKGRERGREDGTELGHEVSCSSGRLRSVPGRRRRSSPLRKSSIWLSTSRASAATRRGRRSAASRRFAAATAASECSA